MVLLRYNALLAHLHSSLSLLEKALKGETVMSVELEKNYDSLLFKNELPESWVELAFPTEANLRDFLKDVQKGSFINYVVKNLHFQIVPLFVLSCLLHYFEILLISLKENTVCILRT